MNRLAAEQKQREQRERHRHVGNDRTRQRRVDRHVEQVRHRHLLVAPQHFPDAVVDNDGVVERVAEDGEQRRDAGEIEIDLGDRHESEGQHDVVHVGDHGAEGELPFEPEPQIDQDRPDGREYSHDAQIEKLAGHPRPHHLDAAGGDGVAESALHLEHRRLLGLLAARLLGEANQDIFGTSEFLELDLADAKLAERRSHLGDIGRTGLALHLDKGAAHEVDAEIQAVGEVQDDGDDGQQRRHREAHPTEAEEIEAGVVGYDTKEAHVLDS